MPFHRWDSVLLARNKRYASRPLRGDAARGLNCSYTFLNFDDSK